MSNPTQGILTVAGAVIGSYFGPVGTQIGGLLGSAAGPLVRPGRIDEDHGPASSAVPLQGISQPQA